MLFLSQCSLFTVFVLEAGFLTGGGLSKWSRLAGSVCLQMPRVGTINAHRRAQVPNAHQRARVLNDTGVPGFPMHTGMPGFSHEF